MAPLPSPEPFELLDTVEVVDARKLRFERNRIKLPMGVEARLDTKTKTLEFKNCGVL